MLLTSESVSLGTKGCVWVMTVSCNTGSSPSGGGITPVCSHLAIRSLADLSGHGDIYAGMLISVLTTAMPICEGLMKPIGVALHRRNLSCH